MTTNDNAGLTLVNANVLILFDLIQNLLKARLLTEFQELGKIKKLMF